MTNAQRFAKRITQALDDMRRLFDDTPTRQQQQVAAGQPQQQVLEESDESLAVPAENGAALSDNTK